jgi:hypothetical protein
MKLRQQQQRDQDGGEEILIVKLTLRRLTLLEEVTLIQTY